MASKYIDIAIAALVFLAMFAFIIGFVISRVVRKRKSIAIAAFLGIAIQIIAVLSLFRLPVSGPLITRLVMGTSAMMYFLLCGGAVAGLPREIDGRQKLRKKLVAGTLAIGILTIAGLITNVRPVLDVVQAAGLLKPKDDYKPETNKDCPANLQSLYTAFEQYADLNDKLPDAASWTDDTDFTSRVPQDEWLHCPAVSNRHDQHFGYAINSAIAGKKLNLNGKPLKSLPNAAATPLLYDSTDLNKNAHDAATSLPRPGRHSGRNNILYLDGHVAAVAPK